MKKNNIPLSKYKALLKYSMDIDYGMHVPEHEHEQEIMVKMVALITHYQKIGDQKALQVLKDVLDEYSEIDEYVADRFNETISLDLPSDVENKILALAEKFVSHKKSSLVSKLDDLLRE